MTADEKRNANLVMVGYAIAKYGEFIRGRETLMRNDAPEMQGHRRQMDEWLEVERDLERMRDSTCRTG